MSRFEGCAGCKERRRRRIAIEYHVFRSGTETVRFCQKFYESGIPIGFVGKIMKREKANVEHSTSNIQHRMGEIMHSHKYDLEERLLEYL